MDSRRRILISAYACAPGEGSEPEVGWQWALQMARFHDVTVLTRANNRPAIESAARQIRNEKPIPNFVYHDCAQRLLDFKARFKAVRVYYQFWQKSAWDVVERLHRAEPFDLMHHVTFATFRYDTAVWRHGAPVIWGPVGGIESIPFHLLPWRSPLSLVHELIRNYSNALLAAFDFHARRWTQASTVILSTTQEMQRQFQRSGLDSRLMPTIGLNTKALPYRPRQREAGPLKLLYVGNIITLKGLDLSLDALELSNTDATFTIIGSGDYLDALKRQAHSLGLESRLSFPGRIPREQMLKMYADYDVFVFPSLHDTGGFAVIEAMFNELPVICLDCGGPAVAVREGCGVKVPLRSRKGIVGELAAAIKMYSEDREKLSRHGKTAREVVLANYDWDKKGEEMARVYEEVLGEIETQNSKLQSLAKPQTPNSK